MSINTFHISGRATKDPIIKEGKSSLILGIAVNRWNSKEKKEDTDFLNVWVYGKQATMVADFVRKGDRVFVEGSVGTFKKDGAQYAETILRANSVEFATVAHPEPEADAPKPRQGRGWDERDPNDPDSYA